MYEEMLSYVASMLEDADGPLTNNVAVYPFRKRSEHIRRVFEWAKRISVPFADIDREALLIAAIFHDSGYSVAETRMEHAPVGAHLARKYLEKISFDPVRTDLICDLIAEHSQKALMTLSDTRLELVLLMEADLLDETGAMEIMWDCMSASLEEEPSYEKAYARMIKYSEYLLTENPMITPEARKIWEEKQKLVSAYLDQLKADLF